MNESRMTYFQKEDILYLLFSQGKEASSIELSPNITAELDEHGELLGLEILNASAFVRDLLLDTTQAKLLRLSQPTHAH